MFPATASAAASNATALSAAACSAATPILGIAASATIWGAYTTLSLQALKKSVELLAKTQGDLATEQAKGFQEFKDQLHATEMRWRTLHTSLITLHSTVSETKGEIASLSTLQEKRAFSLDLLARASEFGKTRRAGDDGGARAPSTASARWGRSSRR